MDEEVRFCTETIMYEAPFAVHKFWPHLHAKSMLRGALSMLQNCPEALGIIPQETLQDDERWRRMVCGLSASHWEASRVDNHTSFAMQKLCHDAEHLSRP